jgi:hypothetical protein
VRHKLGRPGGRAGRRVDKLDDGFDLLAHILIGNAEHRASRVR